MDRATIELIISGVAILGAAGCVWMIWRRKSEPQFADIPTRIALLCLGGGLATVGWGCMAMRNTGYGFLGALQSVQWWVIGTWLAIGSVLFVGSSRDS